MDTGARCLRCSVLLLCAFATGFEVTAQSSAAGDEAAIRALEAKYDEAAVKSDVRAFEELLGDGYFDVDHEGVVTSKAQFLARLKSGDIKYSVSQGKISKIYVVGDTATLYGDWITKGTQKGHSMDGVFRYTATYGRQNGKWRLLATTIATIRK